MSVAKNFRIDEFTNAMLEEIASRTGKTQTDIIELLIRNHVIYDLSAEDSKELMERASERVGTGKNKT